MVMINTGITKAMRKAARFVDLLPVELQEQVTSITVYPTEGPKWDPLRMASFPEGPTVVFVVSDFGWWQAIVDHIGRDNGTVEEEAVQESDTLLTQHRSFLVDGIDVCTNWTEVVGE